MDIHREVCRSLAAPESPAWTSPTPETPVLRLFDDLLLGTSCSQFVPTVPPPPALNSKTGIDGVLTFPNISPQGDVGQSCLPIRPQPLPGPEQRTRKNHQAGSEGCDTNGSKLFAGANEPLQTNGRLWPSPSLPRFPPPELAQLESCSCPPPPPHHPQALLLTE